MLIRLIIMFMVSASLATPVAAENKLKKFLNKLGNELQEGVERLGERGTRNQQAAPSNTRIEAGTCQVFSGSVRTDNDPCRRE